MQLEILNSKEEIARLAPEAASLIRSTIDRPDATYTPDYFLPRVGTSRLPRVVTCYEQGKLVGVLYADELVICGLQTGFAFGGDHCGRGLVLASPEREAEVVAAASEHLLENGIHAIRFYWRASGRETMPILPVRGPGIKVWCSSQYRDDGDWLQLASSYDAFLGRLGPDTRRNLRRYRRKAEELGYTFAPSLTADEYHGAVRRLNAITDYPTEPKRDERDLRFFAQFRRSVRAGLRGPNGELVSIVGGVENGEHVHLLTQLNDLGLRKLSISMVLRAYLIENLIARGVTSVHFVNGTSPMLGRWCEPVLMRTVSIDKQRSVFHPVKRVFSRLALALRGHNRRIPVRLQYLVGSYMVA